MEFGFNWSARCQSVVWGLFSDNASEYCLYSTDIVNMQIPWQVVTNIVAKEFKSRNCFYYLYLFTLAASPADVDTSIPHWHGFIVKILFSQYSPCFNDFIALVCARTVGKRYSSQARQSARPPLCRILLCRSCLQDTRRLAKNTGLGSEAYYCIIIHNHTTMQMMDASLILAAVHRKQNRS